MGVLKRILLAASISWVFSVSLGFVFASCVSGHLSFSTLRLPGVVPVALIGSTVAAIIIDANCGVGGTDGYEKSMRLWADSLDCTGWVARYCCPVERGLRPVQRVALRFCRFSNSGLYPAIQVTLTASDSSSALASR